MAGLEACASMTKTCAGGSFETAQIRGESRFQLGRNNFEFGLCQNAFKLAQYQRVRREDADSQF